MLARAAPIKPQMSSYLDAPARSLRQTLDETQALIAAEFRQIDALYRRIEQRAARIRELEERAATLGEQLIRQG